MSYRLEDRLLLDPLLPEWLEDEWLPLKEEPELR